MGSQGSPPLCCSRGGVQGFDRGLHAGRNGVGVGQLQSHGRDRFSHAHFQGLAANVVGVHGQQVEGIDERDGNDIGLSFDGEEKRARQERLDVAVRGATAFGKDDERHAGAQAAQSRLDRTNGSGGMLLVDANLSGAPKMPADEGVVEKLALEDDAELKGQVNIEDRNIKRRRMGDGEDTRLGVDGLGERGCVTGDGDRGKDRLHDQPRPQARELVLNAAVAVEERTDQRDCAEKERVSPDEGIEDEVRAQVAEVAVARVGAKRRTLIILTCRPCGSIARFIAGARLGSFAFGLRSC
jgi:hypothetical protein